MKNYIGYVNDHSGSMQSVARAAMADYNENIKAVKEAATREMLDTVVSVIGIGVPTVYATERQVVISNPHVLKPIKSWPTPGGTPLYDGIADMINLFKSLPDYTDQNVSFLVLVTTDGDEQHSRHQNEVTISKLIKECQRDGRWTFVFRVPKGSRHLITRLGVPPENVQEWDGTAAGMTASTQATTVAMDNYFRSRSSGVRGSNTFYTDAAKVNLAALQELDQKKISLYVVPDEDNGIEIKPFILRHRMSYLKGAAFFQLTKTEARVQPGKQIIIREQATGKLYGGKNARNMLGISTTMNARVHPGDHKNFDIFIQSESLNRKLVGGTGVLYWKEIGVPFTQAELDRFAPKPTKAPKPAVVQLPKVPVSNTPTKSPIPPTPRAQYFETREEARRYCNHVGRPQTDIKDNGKGTVKGRRWSV